MGPAGPPGGAVTVAPLHPAFSDFPTGTGFQYAFIGAPATVTVTDGQQLAGSAGAHFRMFIDTGEGDAVLLIDLCYRSTGESTMSTFTPAFVRRFAGSLGLNERLDVAATVTPGAGTFEVGLCARSLHDFTATDGPVGWVMVSG
ncbi:MAG: hypothetical protein ACRD0U_16035 [Acidimicrobiales bacterium]